MVTMWRQNKVRHLVFKSKQSSFFKTTFIVLINNVLRKKMQGPSFFTKYCLNRYAITLDIYICMGISPDLIHDYKYTHET